MRVNLRLWKNPESIGEHSWQLSAAQYSRSRLKLANGSPLFLMISIIQTGVNQASAMKLWSAML